MNKYTDHHRRPKKYTDGTMAEQAKAWLIVAVATTFILNLILNI